MSLNPKLLALCVVGALTIVGCNQKEKEQKTPSVEAEKPVVVAESAPKCDDASIKNSLVKALATHISAQLDTAIAQQSSANGADLGRLISQQLSELGIDLQNANADGNVCHIDVIVNLSANDVKFANQYFASTDQPSIAEQAKKYKISLDKNNRLIIPVSYQVIDGQATIDKSSAHTLNIIVDTISASAHTMASGKGAINTQARPAPNVQPLEPVAIPKPTTIEQPKTEKPKAEQPKTEKPETTTPSPKKPSEATAQERPADSKPTPAPEPSEPKTTPPPVATNKNEIAIVETDETY